MRLGSWASAAVFAGTLALGCAAAYANGYGYEDLYTLNVPSMPNASVVQINGCSGGQVAGDVNNGIGEYASALLWSSSAPPVNLTPGSFGEAACLGIGGGQQVGFGAPSSANDENSHALFWNGSAASVVDLGSGPAGFNDAMANGTNGTQQVGSAVTGIQTHAMLWNDTASSVVDLNPAGFNGSEAYATDGIHQVGLGFTGSNSQHALLWSNSATSAIDLNPNNFSSSEADGIGGNQQVGWGNNGSFTTALLWTNTSASAVALNPSGITNSYALGTNGSQQVGYGSVSLGGGTQALLWNGTATAFVNLGSLLPSQFTSSEAFSIDAQGNVFGYAYDKSDSLYDAIEWQTPEPSSATLLAVGGLGLLPRQRRRPIVRWHD